MKNTVFTRALCASLLLVSFSAFAQSSDAGKKADNQRMPPPEALQACVGKTADATCQFNTPRGEAVTGKCAAPSDKPLACRPDHPPKGDQQKGDRPNPPQK